MDIHTRQLRYFMELAQCLNFTKAAMNLYIAQPALSQQIADLEKQLGVTLFERNSRSVSLTPAGKILQSTCPEILNKLESVRQQMLWAQAGLRGSIKIGYLNLFQSMLPGLVQKFRQVYPDVALEFYNGNLHELKAAQENGDLDIGFALIHEDMFPQIDPPMYNVLWREDLCLAIRMDHPFVSSGCEDYQLLEEETYILIDDATSPGFPLIVQNACSEIGIVIKHQRSSREFRSIMIQIEAGIGISILPSGINDFHYSSAENVLFFPIKRSCLDFGVVWPRDSKNAALPLFLDMLKKTVDTVPEK